MDGGVQGALVIREILADLQSFTDVLIDPIEDVGLHFVELVEVVFSSLTLTEFRELGLDQVFFINRPNGLFALPLFLAFFLLLFQLAGNVVFFFRGSPLVEDVFEFFGLHEEREFGDVLWVTLLEERLRLLVWCLLFLQVRGEQFGLVLTEELARSVLRVFFFVSSL